MKFEVDWDSGRIMKMTEGRGRGRGVASGTKMTSVGERGREKMFK
jgi:hypothetical protein